MKKIPCVQAATGFLLKGNPMYDVESLCQEYDVDFKDMTIAGQTFRFATPQTIDRFIDLADITHDFPLWAKIWKASWLLAENVAGQPPDATQKILEIGSGIGVVGVVASRFGHDITLSEYNAHALNFAAANLCLNQCRDVKIQKLDWRHPDLKETYDWIIGSEVLYHERDLEPLLNLFRKYLKPDGHITLTMGVRKGGVIMLDRLQRHFDLTVKKYTIRSEDESTRILCCSMRPLSSINT